MTTHKVAKPSYGLVAEFETPEELIEAARSVRAAGYRQIDAYTPFPVEGLSEALGQRRSPLPLIVLIGGLSGAFGGFALQTVGMVYDYPWIIAGRPYFSWPAFIPITFETGILLAALSAVIGMLVLNRLPRPYHPVFSTPGFRRASIDRFFLCIEASDPLYDINETQQFLAAFRPRRVTEVRC